MNEKYPNLTRLVIQVQNALIYVNASGVDEEKKEAVKSKLQSLEDLVTSVSRELQVSERGQK